MKDVLADAAYTINLIPLIVAAGLVILFMLFMGDFLRNRIRMSSFLLSIGMTLWLILGGIILYIYQEDILYPLIWASTASIMLILMFSIYFKVLEKRK